VETLADGRSVLKAGARGAREWARERGPGGAGGQDAGNAQKRGFNSGGPCERVKKLFIAGDPARLSQALAARLEPKNN